MDDEAAIRALARDEALRVVAQQNAAPLEAERRGAVTAGISRATLSAVFAGIAVGVVFTATVAWPQPTLVEHFVFLAALAVVPVALAVGLGWRAAGPLEAASAASPFGTDRCAIAAGEEGRDA